MEKKIVDNYIEGVNCLQTFMGKEEEAKDILKKYTSEELHVMRVFVYGLLRRYGAPLGEGFNTVKTYRDARLTGPIAVSWKNALSGKNIKIHETGIRKTHFVPGESVIGTSTYPLEIFTIIGSKSDVGRFMHYWDNAIEAAYDRTACLIQALPSEAILAGSLYLDKESRKPMLDEDIIFITTDKPYEWFILSSGLGSQKFKIDLFGEVHLTNMMDIMLSKIFDFEDGKISIERLKKSIEASAFYFRCAKQAYQIAYNNIKHLDRRYDTIFLELEPDMEDFVNGMGSGKTTFNDYLNEMFNYDNIVNYLRRHGYDSLLNLFVSVNEDMGNIYSAGKSFHTMDLSGRSEFYERITRLFREGWITREDYLERIEENTLQREEFMLSRIDSIIKQKKSEYNLVICGAHHLPNLKSKLESMGYEVKVLFTFDEKMTNKMEGIVEEIRGQVSQPPGSSTTPEEEPSPPPEEFPAEEDFPPEEEPRPPKGYFFQTIEEEFGSDKPNLENLREMLYYELMGSSSGDQYSEGVARAAAHKMDINDFRNLNMTLKIISGGIAAGAHMVKSGRPPTMEDLLDWLVRNRTINERARKYFEE